MIDAPISPDILEETLKRNQDTEIVTLLAERLNIDAEEALRIYYSSRLPSRLTRAPTASSTWIPSISSKIYWKTSRKLQLAPCKITRRICPARGLWSHDTR